MFHSTLHNSFFYSERVKKAQLSTQFLSAATLGHTLNQKVMYTSDISNTIDTILFKFTNFITKKGRKSKALRIFSETLYIIQSRTQKNCIQVVAIAIYNVRPLVLVKPKILRNRPALLPYAPEDDKQVKLAIKWLVESALKRKDGSFSNSLASEIIDASNNIGGAIEKKNNMLKNAARNLHSVYYRW